MKKVVFGMLLLVIYSGSNIQYAYSTSKYKTSYSNLDSTKKDTTTKGLKPGPTDTLKTKKPKSK